MAENKLKKRKFKLPNDRTKVIASIAAHEAVKEVTAYIASEAFTKVSKDIDRKIEIGISNGIKQQNKIRVKEQKQNQKRIIKNTELLIKNYRKCVAMVESYKSEKSSDDGTFLASEELTLEKLEQQHAKTYKMVRRIEGALAACEAESLRGTEEERIRFAIMKKRYIDEKRLSIKECMEYFNVSQTKVYTDSTKAISDMASYIFGYDAVIFD